MKTAVIGGGVMGTAILGRALASGALEADSVVLAEVMHERRDALAARLGIRATAHAAEAIEGAELILLAVKPQELGSVSGTVAEEAVIVSILAGASIASIAHAFDHDQVVRVMPNTPAAIGRGISAWTATASVGQVHRDAVRALLRSFGQEVFVDDEKKIDMATAINGSGPAYVFLFIESLIEAGVGIGLPRAQAEALAVETVAGSALYLQESGRTPADLRAAVTSAGGTTAAALFELEKGAFRATVMEAVRAAHRRAIELGKAQ
jgi:pyrroline-5-carboxylate reductase